MGAGICGLIGGYRSLPGFALPNSFKNNINYQKHMWYIILYVVMLDHIDSIEGISNIALLLSLL